MSYVWDLKKDREESSKFGFVGMMEMRYVELNEICDVRDGTHDSPKYVQEGFPLVTSKNIIDGKLDLSTVNYLTQKDYDKINERSKVDRGDIIMPMIGTIGNPLLIGDFYKFAIKNVALIKFPNKNISNRYIWYFLKSDAFNKYVAEKNRGGTQKFLSLNDIRRMKVPYISYFEQISVVEKLDMVYKVIMQRIKELQLLDDLIKARFVEMFGDPVINPMSWEKKRFDEICENLDSRRKPISSSDRVGGIYPYYGASGIVDYVEDYIFNENILLVSEDGANLLMRSTPIAFSVSGKVWVNNHAHVVRFKEMCLQKYVEIYFSLIDISDNITGSAQPKLNQAKLNAMLIPIPDSSLLEQYRKFINRIDKSKVVVASVR